MEREQQAHVQPDLPYGASAGTSPMATTLSGSLRLPQSKRGEDACAARLRVSAVEDASPPSNTLA